MNQLPQQITIVGAGQMGSAAAACFQRAGFQVQVWIRDAAKCNLVQAQIAEKLTFLETHFGPVPQTLGTSRVTSDLESLVSKAEFVLECITESIPEKGALLQQFAPAAERGAVLASCTSGLSISQIGMAAGSAVARRLVGAHFWNPPHLIPIVEVVAGEQTEPDTPQLTAALLVAAGKQPVHCRDVPGFIGNRLLHAIWREAIHLVQTGVCTAADVDRVARLTFGLRLPALGPFENMDLVGLKLLDQIQSYLLQELSIAQSTLPLVKEKLAAGETGMSSGQGFYNWQERSSAELIRQRDEQIVRQLKYLATLGRDR